ncbi:MAG: hypothetical protein B5766_02895 [Candidatus Lumbricidophila eiseniae]|uniref:YcaO domain-containing protein n=1 Tax=Candidatus Lumbricidiphila eiseniae TaxID=1969409 RepID=A0A2A6FTQ4_9MICO|nr:MAG: hypothetical protein B5766_02895 [Candidatus Lumbricidophila eiseniae]
METDLIHCNAPSPKRFVQGTHRMCAPGETFERFSPFLGRCGITRLANVTNLDTIGLPVYVAIRPNSRGLSTSQGKGITRDAARVSAMMESFEGWHGENIVVTGPYARRREAEDLSGIRAVDVAGLYRRGESSAWSERRRLPWCVGRDLLTDSAVLVPYDAVSTDFTETVMPTPIIRTTNGLASGNLQLEAELHGLYEVLERDSVGRWTKQNPDWSDVVDPSTLDDENREIIAAVREAGLVVAVRQLPSWCGLPVFAAMIAPSLAQPSLPRATFSGYGAHLDPKVAVSRALTEAVQSRLALISGNRDDLWPSEYARVLDHRAADEWSRSIAAAPLSVNFTDVRDLSTSTLDEDLDLLLARLRDHVDFVVAVDLRHEELGIPVTKIVVSGMHGIPFDERRRFGISESISEVPKL